jgi:sensor histidine kinase regulating citrate/malate metabolism
LNEDLWVQEYQGAITVCDKEGTIIRLNDKACKLFEKDGGKDLIGTNVLDCHPGLSRTKLAEILKKGVQNIYTIEKSGVKILIYQTPWYKNGEYMGIMELELEIPFEMPHFVR